jgi:hypothetical protein
VADALLILRYRWWSVARRLAYGFGAPVSRVCLAAAIGTGRITVAEGSRLAKKPNYDFEKRRKEMERKKKKDAKREERLQRKRDGLPDEEGEIPEIDVDGDASDDVTPTAAPAAP